MIDWLNDHADPLATMLGIALLVGCVLVGIGVSL